jgi:hypothetical protein
MKSVILAFLFIILSGCASKTIPPVIISGRTVVFQGLISEGAVDEFVRVIELHDVNRLLIASGGGHVAPAIRMARAIYDREMDVEVVGLCFSSCANYIFPAGRNKLITGLGVVGWHGNMQHLLYLHQIGEVPIEGAWLDEVTKLASLETDFFKTIGVDSFVCWFGKLPPYNVPNTYFLAPVDMAKFGIGNVAVRPDYALTDLSMYNASGVENVRFVQVQWESLRRLPFESP